MSPDALIEALSGSVITRPDGVVVYLNAEGKPHRTAGPAIVYPNGMRAWYLYGVAMVEDEHSRRIASGDYHDV